MGLPPAALITLDGRGHVRRAIDVGTKTETPVCAVEHGKAMRAGLRILARILARSHLQAQGKGCQTARRMSRFRVACPMAARLRTAPGGDAPFPVWEVLNWFVGAGMIITVIAAYVEKRRTDGDADAGLKRYLETNAVFYGAVAIFIVFYWNWFSNLDPDNVPDGQLWIVIDTMMPIVMGVAGCRLWRNAEA